MSIWNRVFQEFFWTLSLFSDADVPVMTHEPLGEKKKSLSMLRNQEFIENELVIW